MWRALIVLGVLSVPTLAFAAPYFEFAPDYSQALTVQPGVTVSQIFVPLNDRMSVIELWVSTGGATASVDIALLNPSGATVAARTVPLGSITDSAGGTRRSIILPSQLSVSGGEPYRLNITPAGSAVKLYYSTSVSIAPGSGVAGPAAYRYGAAIVDGVEQGYSFKFALTEAAETTAPSAADVQVTHPTIGQAYLSFTASEPVDVQVVYGSRTVVWTGQFSPCLSGISRCSTLLKVTPGTSYSYTATLKDAWGNISTTQGSFVAVGTGPTETATVTSSPGPSGPPSTASPSPTTSSAPVDQVNGPPIIINPRIISLTPTTATFAWTTNEAASSWLVILVLPELTAWAGSLDNTLELEHYVAMQGLPADQFLRARLTSTDASGESTVVNIDFKTTINEVPQPSIVPGVSTQPTPTPSPSFTVIISPSNSPTTSPSASPSALISPTGAPTTSPTSSSTPTPSVIAYPSTSTGPGEITWDPADGDFDGYRIDIFDEFGNLITTLAVGKDVTSLELPAGVGKGARVIVYADRDGAFEKVGVTTVSDRPAGDTPSYATSIAIIGGGVVLLAALIGAFVWERRRQKVVASNETSIGLGSGSQAGR